ncbi:MAG: MOSC domain-containing protein [Oleiphilaceae bacterium]|nr:MOSC domain-containing protein [Oleiphilaceae bacterium]
MQIQSLFCYPVKSLPGIQVDRLMLDDFGPQGDRRWMITDPLGRFITQRTHPELARVAVDLDAVGAVSIDVPLQGVFTLRVGHEGRNVTIWDDWIGATRADPGPAEALSRFLDTPVDLVYMPSETFRPVDRVWVKERRRVSFADGFPFLVVNQASAEELGGRLGRPVDMRRFRPNIVVSGAKAWAEDGWSGLVTGNVRLDLVKPCSRCVMTTVDPEQGINDPDQQPLRMLATYRNRVSGIMFGKNGVHTGEGPLRVGDSVSLT